MRYFVTLDGQQFSLSLGTARAGEPVSIQGSRPEPMQAELLRSLEPGRPALVRVDGRVFRALAIAPLEQGAGLGSAPAPERPARVNGWAVALRIESELERRAQPVRAKAATKGARVRAPMPGRIVKLDVSVGQVVEAGAPLLGIEAMKMENELRAPSGGRVARVAVALGVTVEADQELIVLEPLEPG